MFRRALLLTALYLIAILPGAWALEPTSVQNEPEGIRPPLKNYSVDPKQITVSGLSAGAMMAVQMHLAFSSQISGVGVIAGAIHGCAEGNEKRATSVCMKAPGSIDVAKYVSRAEADARAGKLDVLENLSSSRVFIFAGAKDSIVNPGEGRKLETFYQSFVPASQIRTEWSIPASHGQPTLAFGSSCAQTGSPWLLKCGYDAAGEILKALFPSLRSPVEARPENMIAFNQSEFFKTESGLHSEGYVYVPARCQAGSGVECKLHVALHGCLQNQDAVGDAYRLQAGYNRWAEANGIVILYPSAHSMAGNPYGCWDWWGFTGPDYLSKTGKQLKALKAMIDRITGNELETR